MAPQRMPAAEVEVSLDVVRRLLAAQHPDLAPLPLEVLANGWDNLVCRLGDDLMVRLPRRAQAADLVLHEQRWLPVLAPGLPLPVPAPVRVGRPALGYPWSWSVVPWLPGEVAAATAPADPRAAAVALGEFLGALHVAAPTHAPVNRVRGIPLAGREEALLATLADLDGAVDRPAVLAAWSSALAAPVWDGPPVWLHGDLHPANILVHDGRLSGVIDFGDITSGDPATDLAVAWMLLPADCHEAFRSTYAEHCAWGGDGAAWARARGWALALSIAILGHSADHPLMAGIGRRTLEAVLGDL